MSDDWKTLAEDPELPTCENKNSPEYRPLSIAKNNLMKEFQERIIQEIERIFAESQALPTKEEVMSVNNGKNANGEQIPWRWTEEEKEQAIKWASLPLIRCRFLRARSWKLEQSMQMIMDTIRWRRTFMGIGVYNLKEEDIKGELSLGKVYYRNYDKEGRPVCYIRCKLHDSNTRNLDELQMCCVWAMDNDWKMVKNNVFRFCIVFDLDGFGLKNMDYAFTKFMIGMMQNYFPDTMGVCLIVNSPWIFRTCWSILKGWIDPASQQKIVFINVPDLKNYIDIDKIPKEYGGNDNYVYQYQYPFAPFADFGC